MADVLHHEDVGASKIASCPRLCLLGSKTEPSAAGCPPEKGDYSVLADEATKPKVPIGPSFSAQSSTKEEAIEYGKITLYLIIIPAVVVERG